MRQPPHNFEAESSVLGSLILNPETIHDVRPILRTEDFHLDDHATIFRAIVTLQDSNRPADGVAVCDELRRVGKFEAIGGHDAIVKLVDSIPHAADAAYHARIVREKAVAREVIRAAELVISRVYSNEMTGTELRSFAEQTFCNLAVDREQRAAVRFDLKMEAALRRLDQRLAGMPRGLSTGFFELDDLLKGMQPEQLIVLAARPSIGKTALAFNVAENVVFDTLSPAPALFVSLEMSGDQLADRALCGAARIDGARFADPRDLTDADLAALEDARDRFRDAPLFISDDALQSVAQVGSIARLQRARDGIGLLVVDYLQLVEPDEAAGRANRQEQVAVMTRALKQLAKTLKIPVLLLCQLNREVEKRADKRPQIADLRESGAIEQDADTVMLLHRPAYYDQNDRPGEADLIIAKNRSGPTGTVRLSFDGPTTRFSDYHPCDPRFL